ncbi:hypothetical protein [Micromonospora sp. IBHARD004]|uniref:hypothetical protein n=1 Tax=Micromonospora sp. IBHARD004 TaxID=3457764 RepID=UPI004059E686
MGTPYTPAARFRRTQAERVDQLLSWKRSDQAFFAVGACHVLAWVAVERYASAGFGIMGLRQLGEPYVSHVIISNGRWAFDHDGWTPLPELLRAKQYAHDPLPHARRYLQQRPRPPEVV